MVFSSLPFLFFFFPTVLLCYFAVPDKAKNAILLVFSLLFYGYGEPVYILLMVGSISVDVNPFGPVHEYVALLTS